MTLSCPPHVHFCLLTSRFVQIWFAARAVVEEVNPRFGRGLVNSVPKISGSSATFVVSAVRWSDPGIGLKEKCSYSVDLSGVYLPPVHLRTEIETVVETSLSLGILDDKIIVEYFDPWRWDHYILSKRRYPTTHWHSVVRQTKWILSHNAEKPTIRKMLQSLTVFLQLVAFIFTGLGSIVRWFEKGLT